MQLPVNLSYFRELNDSLNDHVDYSHESFVGFYPVVRQEKAHFRPSTCESVRVEREN